MDTAAAPAIQMQGLTKFYGDQPGAVDVDLRIERGEVFGFLGPNGAGKSTTIRMLLDFIRPTAGSAQILGLDCQRDSVEAHRHTGFLSPDLGLYEQLTVRVLLEWTAKFRGLDLDRRIDELAERLDLDLDRRIDELSTGNRQKVGLVHAFMHDPDVLILDEPTSGLDPLMRREFEAMAREAADAGSAVFLSSHVIDEVERSCDRVAIIRASRIVAVEDVAELASRSLRRIVIRFADPPDPAPYRSLEDVHGVSVADDRLHLQASGSLDAIVKLAARGEVIDLISEPADLEEVFLHFYRDDQSEADRAESGPSGTNHDVD
ncbi:MAG: ABC transporter ATP-binding protein [Acidimicrobiales bacterium]